MVRCSSHLCKVFSLLLHLYRSSWTAVRGGATRQPDASRVASGAGMAVSGVVHLRPQLRVLVAVPYPPRRAHRTRSAAGDGFTRSGCIRLVRATLVVGARCGVHVSADRSPEFLGMDGSDANRSGGGGARTRFIGHVHGPTPCGQKASLGAESATAIRAYRCHRARPLAAHAETPAVRDV